VDLEPLKIDRDATRRRAVRRSPWIGRLVALFVLGGLAWIFSGPILGFVDRVRLPEVRTLRVLKTNPAVAATVRGASSNGYIVAKTRAALSADTPGRIVQMNVEEGSVVRKGDVVARLYSDEYAAYLRRAEADLSLAEAGRERARAEHQVAADELERLKGIQRVWEADLEQQKAFLELAQIEFDRATKLLEEQIGTAEARDQAKSQLQVTQARIESARAQIASAALAVTQGESRLVVATAGETEALARVEVMKAARDGARATLEKTEVRAPFDGIVVLKDAEVGEVVSPNVQGGTSARGSVVTMVDFASLEVQAEVPETSLAGVVVGRGAKIYLDAYPEKPYAGRVDRIWPTANRTKATVEVRVEFLERDDRLRPEMGVRVVFDAEEAPADGGAAEPAQPVVLVPVESIVKIDGASGVFVLEREIVRFRKIALGAERSGRAIVQSGLEEGETIVLDPPARLADGDRVRVKS
jgi:RND family efflux transporter MFP subunit